MKFQANYISRHLMLPTKHSRSPHEEQDTQFSLLWGHFRLFFYIYFCFLRHLEKDYTRNKLFPLALYEGALKILIKEGYAPPLEDSNLIILLLLKDVSNSFSCEDSISIVALASNIPCMMFSSSSCTFEWIEPTFESWWVREMGLHTLIFWLHLPVPILLEGLEVNCESLWRSPLIGWSKSCGYHFFFFFKEKLS